MNPGHKRNKRKDAAPYAVGALDFHAGLAAHALILAVGGEGSARARAYVQYEADEIAALAYRMARAMQGARIHYGLGVRHET